MEIKGTANDTRPTVFDPSDAPEYVSREVRNQVNEALAACEAHMCGYCYTAKNLDGFATADSCAACVRDYLATIAFIDGADIQTFRAMLSGREQR